MEIRGRGQRSLRPTNRVETAKIGAKVLLFFSGDKKICYSFLFVFSFLVYPFESCQLEIYFYDFTFGNLFSRL